MIKAPIFILVVVMTVLILLSNSPNRNLVQASEGMVPAYCQQYPTSHPTAEPGTWERFSNLKGTNMTFKVYTPSQYNVNVTGSKVPLVMMLHGCAQNMDIFSATTQYAGLAEIENFIVVFPSQDPTVKNSCFQWFNPESQVRGGGDAAVLASIVDNVAGNGKWDIDRQRVFVGGLSAGAAMSVVMGVTYPDYFAAIAVGSGQEYGTNGTSNRHGGPDPILQGEIAFKAMGDYGSIVSALVLHGTDDYTVFPINGDQVCEMALNMNSLVAPRSRINTDFQGGSTPKNHAGQDIVGADRMFHGQGPSSGGAPGHTFTEYQWLDHWNQTIVDYYKIDGMGHAWSAGGYSPGAGATRADPLGPDATLLSWTFFKSHGRACLRT